MAPARKISTEHFTHPGHPLTYISCNTQFLCDGCKKLGTGNRYRCGMCDFDQHEYCYTCPTTLASFVHPTHQLALVFRKPQGARNTERVCNVCRSFVNGLFYRCKACDFDVHPLCTQLPQHARHPLHAHHALWLQQLPSGPSCSGSGCCMVCKTTSPNAWGYRCGVCDFDIHLKCFNSVPTGPVCAHSGVARGVYKAYQNLSSVQGGGHGDELKSMRRLFNGQLVLG